MRLALLLASSLLALPALAAPPAPAPAAAEPEPNVTVRYTDLAKFTDATFDNRPDTREDVARGLTEHLVGLGERYLPPGQRLEIEITDVDLAGRYEPWQQPQTWDARYLRDVTWPRVSLNYRLLEGERELASGKETVTDMNYQRRAGLRSGSDRLRYEKAMLDDWFRGKFDPALRKQGAGAS